MRRFLVMLVFSAPWAISASAADRAPSGDLDRLQGRWVARAGSDRSFDVTIEIRGSRVEVRIGSAGGLALTARGELKLDESATPRTLDWVKFRSPDGGEFPEILAIYEFRGDSLRVCNGGPNDARPTEFTPGDGPLADVVVFERPGAREVGPVADARPGK